MAYLAIAVSLAATFALATVGGILLHHAASTQRQTLRTQTLSAVAFQLQNLFEQADAAKAVSPSLATQHLQALADARAAFANVKVHDGSEAARLQSAYTAYVRDATQRLPTPPAGAAAPPPRHGRWCRRHRAASRP